MFSSDKSNNKDSILFTSDFELLCITRYFKKQCVSFFFFSFFMNNYYLVS